MVKLKKCCVARCGATTASKPDLKFYGLPNIEDRRIKWLEVVKYVKASTKSFWICGLHFPRGRKTFKNNCPTIFPWSEKWPSVIDEYNRTSKSICETSVNKPCSSRRKRNKTPDPLALPVAKNSHADSVGKNLRRLFIPKKTRTNSKQSNSMVFKMFVNNQHSEQWMEFDKETPALSCMTQYNALQRVKASIDSSSNTSSFPFETSDTAPNLACSPVKKEKDEDDGECEDPAVLLVTGKATQLMKLLQKCREKNGISSTLSGKHQSYPWKREQEPVCNDMEDMKHTIDQRVTSFEESERRLLLQDPLTINVEDITYMSVFKRYQEDALARFIVRESAHKTSTRITRKEICRLVYDFCVGSNIVRPAMWNISQSADTEWVKGFMRRYPIPYTDMYSSKNNLDKPHDNENGSSGKDNEVLVYVLPIVSNNSEDEKSFQIRAFERDHNYAVRPKSEWLIFNTGEC